MHRNICVTFQVYISRHSVPKIEFGSLLLLLLSSPRSLAGAAMFITSVILGTVIFVTKKGSTNVG